MGAREVKKSNTRRRLADLAIQMFSQYGYDTVTMAEVATAAGVSRRTAFRYFPSKDDLLMQYPAEWLVVFDQLTQEHRGQPLPDRLGAACFAVADHIEADPEPIRTLFGLAASHPGLAGSYAVSSSLWVDRISSEIQLDGTDETESQMLAAAVMAVINTACEVWAATDQPLAPLITRGLELLAQPLRQATIEHLVD